MHARGVQQPTYKGQEMKKFIHEAEQEERLGFVRKVLGILFVQLSFTFVMCLGAMTTRLVFNFVNSPLVLISSIFLVIIPMLVITCSREQGTKVPNNYIWLFLFTLGESCTVSGLCSLLDEEVVIIAGLLTIGVVTLITAHAITTKDDFTGCGVGLCIFAIAIIGIGIVSVIFPSFLFEMVYLCLGVVLFGIYLIIDLQRMIGGKHQQFPIDAYVLAALHLYMDIITIFIKILQIVNKTKNRKD